MANGDSGRAALLTAEDENAIRSVLVRLGDAWASSDGDAYAACFAEDSDYITFNGMHLRGRAANAKLHSALFRGVLKNTKLSAEIERLELLASGVALVHTVYESLSPLLQASVLHTDAEMSCRSWVDLLGGFIRLISLPNSQFRHRFDRSIGSVQNRAASVSRTARGSAGWT